jgi:hypothetical protein
MYDQVSRTMYLEAITTLPGDFLTRALAAAWQVIKYGFWGLPVIEPGGALSPLAVSLRPFIQAGWILAWAVVIVTLLARNVRLGLFACFALAYLCAYPIVQFDTRHYFHLAFLAWIPVGLATSLLLRERHGIRAAIEAGDIGAWRAPADLPARADWIRALSIFAGLVALAAVVMSGARWYQEDKVAELLARYRGASAEDAPVLGATEKDGKLRITYAGKAPLPERRSTGGMLRLDVGGPGCAPGRRTLTLGLSGPEPGYEFRKEFPIDVSPGHPMTTIFAPLYFERARLDRVWVEVPANDKGCLAGTKWLDPNALPSLWVGAIS